MVNNKFLIYGGDSYEEKRSYIIVHFTYVKLIRM